MICLFAAKAIWKSKSLGRGETHRHYPHAHGRRRRKTGASESRAVAESYIDLNRSSTPLIEIVSEPDIRDAEEAVLYVQKLRQTLKFLGVSDVNMEEGSLRCDVNISLRPLGQTALGTRAEIKNLNSFRSIQKAIEVEIDRQSEILLEGGQVVQETRLYDRP